MPQPSVPDWSQLAETSEDAEGAHVALEVSEVKRGDDGARSEDALGATAAARPLERARMDAIFARLPALPTPPPAPAVQRPRGKASRSRPPVSRRESLDQLEAGLTPRALATFAKSRANQSDHLPGRQEPTPRVTLVPAGEDGPPGRRRC